MSSTSEEAPSLSSGSETNSSSNEQLKNQFVGKNKAVVNDSSSDSSDYNKNGQKKPKRKKGRSSGAQCLGTDKKIKIRKYSDRKPRKVKKMIGKTYECSICLKVFGSGQALGGHMRAHSIGSKLRRR